MGQILTKGFAAVVLVFAFYSPLRADARQASADSTVYLGYRAGMAIINLDVGSSSLFSEDDADFSQGVLAGYQFDSAWGAELFWQDAGSTEVFASTSGATRGLAELEVYGAGATWRHEYRPAVDLYVEAGMASLKREYRYYADERSDRETDPYLGLGLRWSPWESWQLRAGYTFFNQQVQVTTLGIVKHFYPWGKPEPAALASEPEPQPDMIEQSVMQCDDFTLHFNGVEFDKASVALNDEARSRLDDLSLQLKALPGDIEMEIRAHADEQGTESYNYALSQVRARAVRDYLASTGIALSRIHAVGYGEWVLPGAQKADGSPEDYRRAELTLLGIEKYLAETTHCQKLVRRYDVDESKATPQ